MSPLETAMRAIKERDFLREALLAAVAHLPNLPDGIQKMLAEDMRLNIEFRLAYSAHQKGG